MYGENNNGSGMYMPVGPIGYGGGYGNGGFGGFGGDGLVWIIFGLLLGGLGGFGGFGGGWGMMNGMWGMDGFPWILASNANNANGTQAGFNQQALGTTLAGIQGSINSGFGDTALGIANLGQQICQAGNGVTAAVTSGFANAETAASNRQIASMQQSFANAQAIDTRLDSLAMALQKCCCDNQLATESLRATVLQENCQDRYEAQRNAADIIAAGNANTQRIVDTVNGGIRTVTDKLCQLELDGVRNQLDSERRANLQLQNSLNMAAARADNLAQTAQIERSQALQTAQIIAATNPTPIPSYNVPNPYTGCCGNQGYYNGCNRCA